MRNLILHWYTFNTTTNSFSTEGEVSEIKFNKSIQIKCNKWGVHLCMKSNQINCKNQNKLNGSESYFVIFVNKYNGNNE